MLALDRFRWQIALVFKRQERLLHLDALTAKNPALSRTFILANLLGGLLVEDVCHRFLGISPLRTNPRRPLSRWRLTEAPAAALRMAIGISRPLHEWLADAPRLRPRFHDPPRRRHSQSAWTPSLHHLVQE